MEADYDVIMKKVSVVTSPYLHVSVRVNAAGDDQFALGVEHLAAAGNHDILPDLSANKQRCTCVNNSPSRPSARSHCSSASA